MNIILKRLTLENFKGIKNKTIEFNENITNISGDNATGKTTIFDAYSWLLWNKDSQNKADFNIKTIGENGEYIRNLEHTVEGEFLLIDGDEKEPLLLRKTLTEDWGTKRGRKEETFNGNNTEYFINGLKVKLKDFTKRIETLITNEQFKLLSNPFHFNVNLKTKEKRALILSLINNVTDEEIIDKNTNLEPLKEFLKTYKVDEVLAMNKDKRSLINKRLEVLPVKINERYDSKKELDFDTLEFKKKNLSGTIDKIDKDLANQDNTAALKDKQQKLRDLTIEQENIIADVEKQNRENKRNYEEVVEDRNKDIDFYNKKIKEAEQNISNIEKQIENITNQKAEYAKEWEEIANGKIDFDVEDTCPTCGQQLPTENIEEQRNLIKSNKLERIGKLGKKCNEDIAMHERDLSGLEHQVEHYKKELEQIEKAIPVEPTEVIIPQAYHDITEEITELEAEIKEFNVSDNTESIEKKKELQQELEEINSQLAFKEVNKIADEKIAEYEAEQKKLLAELEEADRIINLCDQFTKTKVDYISTDINNMFKLVKFKLFETQINGGINEVCEATVDNVPFNDLNNAMKINAGIDIINTLSKHYGIKTPIFIDNAESVNKLEETDSQVIRLIVSKDKELVVK